MKKKFEKNGGYILHLDGSAESGDEITFTSKEGKTGFTIDSWIMPSEGREYIVPFLESLRDTYGKPLTVVRDMWEEIADSVAEVFPGVSQQVCHYHFVRNLGDILFKHRYEELRRIILKTKILARVLALKKICMDGISSHERILIAEHYWVRLAMEYVLYPRDVLEMLKKIVMWK